MSTATDREQEKMKSKWYTVHSLQGLVDLHLWQTVRLQTHVQSVLGMLIT